MADCDMDLCNEIAACLEQADCLQTDSTTTLLESLLMIDSEPEEEEELGYSQWAEQTMNDFCNLHNDSGDDVHDTQTLYVKPGDRKFDTQTCNHRQTKDAVKRRVMQLYLHTGANGNKQKQALTTESLRDSERSSNEIVRDYSARVSSTFECADGMDEWMRLLELNLYDCFKDYVVIMWKQSDYATDCKITFAKPTETDSNQTDEKICITVKHTKHNVYHAVSRAPKLVEANFVLRCFMEAITAYNQNVHSHTYQAMLWESAEDTAHQQIDSQATLCAQSIDVAFADGSTKHFVADIETNAEEDSKCYNVMFVADKHNN